VNAIAPDTIEISDKAGYSTKLVVDPASGLPKKQIYTGIAMNGPPAEVEEIYNSFADVNGVKLPSSTTVLQGGKKFSETKILETKVNSGLKMEDLAKKP